MTKEDILKSFDSSENVQVEFKSAKGGLPESFWETFSAFANTNGGVIVLGVKEKDGKFIPDALSEEQIITYKKRFWDCAHNKEKVSATMLTERDVFESEIHGEKVLVFRVPRASYDIRPVYLTKSPFGNTFKRNHESDYRCTDSEVRLMFSDAHHTTLPFDNQILPNYTIEDIDIASLKGYRQRFSLKKENHPWNELNDMAFMSKLGVYRVDRETGEEGFTRAGVLMFGKTESIIDQACTPWYFVDYQEKISNDSQQRWIDRVYPDGTWEANLYQFFFRVYNKLIQNLSVPFLLDGVTRQDETSAHVAIREALVNTLVHCNYAVQGNIVITKTKNQITFRNPGSMLISVEDFYAGSQSLCRNPILQKFFIQLGIGEKAGSGADFIVKGWQNNQLARPLLEEKVQPDVVTLTFQLGESKNSTNVIQSLFQVCPKFVPSLSQVCPKLQIGNEEQAKIVLQELLSVKEASIPFLMSKIKEKNRSRFKHNIINPLIEAELVEPTIKDKPTSPKQTYMITEKAIGLINAE